MERATCMGQSEIMNVVSKIYTYENVVRVTFPFIVGGLFVKNIFVQTKVLSCSDKGHMKLLILRISTTTNYLQTIFL